MDGPPAACAGISVWQTEHGLLGRDGRNRARPRIRLCIHDAARLRASRAAVSRAIALPDACRRFAVRDSTPDRAQLASVDMSGALVSVLMTSFNREALIGA